MLERMKLTHYVIRDALTGETVGKEYTWEKRGYARRRANKMNRDTKSNRYSVQAVWQRTDKVQG